MCNKDIRLAAFNCNVRLWQIADTLGIADSSLSRKLRKELSTEEKKKIFAAIERLSQGVN